MNARTCFALLGITAFAVLELGSQSVQPNVSITTIPSWGQDGQIIGTVYGGGAQTAAFVPDLGWQGLASACSPLPVQGSQFSASTTTNVVLRAATRFSAYLVPANVPISCSGTATVPFAIQHNALATATYPRLPQLSKISFAGLDWYVKDAPIQVYPGPQWFLKDNAYVDSLGQMRLRVAQCRGSWCAAEIYTTQAIGYGTLFIS